jgi:Flp pilus assembly protein TadD
MKTRTILSIGLTALVATGTIGGIAVPGMTAIAASSENPKAAAKEADKARKALAKRKAEKAVGFAETAVSYAPLNAEYRALLGQSYLLAGRFVSAHQAFTDALSLDPTNGKVALNLALTEIAKGDWAGARNTLEAHANTIDVSDRGLAFALAGDPVKAIELLTPAVRAADATAKTRQNLALSLALAGRWAEAKSVAAIDIAPDQLDARIMEWASFSRPANAYDQVASLLGVKPIDDAGQPVQLALNQSGGNVMVAAATAAPLDAYMPGVPENAGDVVAEVPVFAEAAPEPTQIAGTGPQVVFGPREEIVQAIPGVRYATASAPAYAPSVQTAAVASAPAGEMAKGRYFVQLGAFANAAVARDAWRKTSARVPQVSQFTPQTARVSTKAGNFHRLSVGGFARADADSLCRTVKAGGGACFVRVQAGDQVASWARSGTQLAAR